MEKKSEKQPAVEMDEDVPPRPMSREYEEAATPDYIKDRIAQRGQERVGERDAEAEAAA